MSVNLFVPVKPGFDIEAITEAVNSWADEAGFDWAAPFEGEGGHLLTMAEALAFDGDTAPVYVLHQYSIYSSSQLTGTEGELFYCAEGYAWPDCKQTGPADWRALLTAHPGTADAWLADATHVLFYKVRL